MQNFILSLLVAVLAFAFNPLRTTTVIKACNNTHQTGTNHDDTMANAWIPFRNKGRGISPLNKRGLGPPRGGRNAADPSPANAATREESPIASRLSTSLYNNSTTDGTLALFLQVTQRYPTRHSITVSPEHVLKLLRRPHTPKLTFAFPKCYSHNIHPRSPLRGTAALVKPIRSTLTHMNTYLINYASIHSF